MARIDKHHTRVKDILPRSAVIRPFQLEDHYVVAQLANVGQGRTEHAVQSGRNLHAADEIVESFRRYHPNAAITFAGEDAAQPGIVFEESLEAPKPIFRQPLRCFRAHVSDQEKSAW